MFTDRACPEHPDNGILKMIKNATLSSCSVDSKVFAVCYGILLFSGDLGRCSKCNCEHIRCHSCDFGSSLVDNNKGSTCIICERHICQGCCDHSAKYFPDDFSDSETNRSGWDGV